VIRERVVRLLRAREVPRTQSPFPDGHFYSPVVDVADVAQRRTEIWPEGRCELPGIDFNHSAQLAFLEEKFPRFFCDYDYPHEGKGLAPHEFFTNNGRFEWLDSRALFVMLREVTPKKIVEVGSGYSSLLMADVNRRFLEGRAELICIEPFPPEFLLRGVPGVSSILQRKVQDSGISFEDLEANDILFIDSSHVSKTGSDVNYLILNVLPRLAPGVMIHFHDIFLPRDYPWEWVVNQRRSWNEQYLVQAMLMFSHGFEVVFGSAYAAHCMPDAVRHALGGRFYGGGSLWVRRRVSA
jgi:hypothetical protein